MIYLGSAQCIITVRKRPITQIYDILRLKINSKLPDHVIICEIRQNLDSSIDVFINDFTNLLLKLVPHSYVAKVQAQYLNDLKDNLQEGEFVVIGDFAENIQWWCKTQCRDVIGQTSMPLFTHL